MAETTRQALLKKIQQFDFAAYDMLLYLDTHPDDKKAFALYRDLVNSLQDLLVQYQHSYGPLTPEATVHFDEFNWLKNPWPWDNCRCKREADE